MLKQPKQHIKNFTPNIMPEKKSFSQAIRAKSAFKSGFLKQQKIARKPTCLNTTI